MKFGMSINPNRPLLQEIENVSKWGLDFVEIYIEPPLTTPELLSKQIPEIKKILKENNLFAIGHAQPWCDLGSPDLTVRAAWLIEMKKVISVAAKLGLKRVDIHAHSAGVGFLSPVVNAIIMDNLIASFAYIIETAQQHKIEISAENTWEFPKEFMHLLSKVKGLSATLDIGHAFMRSAAELKEYLAIKEVSHLHIHDAKGTDDHLTIGTGKIPFKLVAYQLKKRNYNGTATIEVIGPNLERHHSLEKFRELMEKTQ